MQVDCLLCSKIDISKNIYSQKGEELIIKNIFNQLNINNGFCIEFGAYDGVTVSNTKLLRNNGWNSLLIDCDYFSPEVEVYRLNCDNVNNYFLSKNVPKDFDLLSVDIDGIDIYIIDKILNLFSPKVIITEFNRYFEKGISKAVLNDENFSWEGGTVYYGASYSAFEKMFLKHRYNIGIVQEQNIYAFREDIALLSKQTNYDVFNDQKSLKNVEKFINY